MNGDPDSAVVTVGKDAFYVRMRDGAFGTLRLGSTIADGTAETLVSSASGLERVLGVDFQVSLEESPLPLTMSGAGTGTQAQQIGFLGPGGPGRATERVTDIDYDGAVGDYYREIWCHIPWVIADYLHSQGRYSDAKRWYEAIFDPAAAQRPPANPEYKRVWQFREFRREPVESLRTALSRKAELDAYASDPFSPHAIARLRPGAYEKAMVMQYVDNLLDWGDSLFTQFTAESINEATMLYILALDILGPRARDAGDVRRRAARQERQADQEGLRASRSGAAGGPRVRDRGGESLRHRAAGMGAVAHRHRRRRRVLAERARASATAGSRRTETARSSPTDGSRPAPQYWSVSGGTPLGRAPARDDARRRRTAPFSRRSRTGGRSPSKGTRSIPRRSACPSFPGSSSAAASRGATWRRQPGLSLDDRLNQIPDTTPPVNAKPWQLLDSSIAFCIPDNKELRAYWDRVEGRLFNIRNCRDIDGNARGCPSSSGPRSTRGC